MDRYLIPIGSDHTLVGVRGTMFPVARHIDARHHIALVSNDEAHS